jgi:hypothetical protein
MVQRFIMTDPDSGYGGIRHCTEYLYGMATPIGICEACRESVLAVRSRSRPESIIAFAIEFAVAMSP